ncbi:MAG TPA: GNAT family N-acetyltransferase [Acidimicrobiales bacterium]|nr:GNAT family N-acetyltransferase [Acidimicrobiales bacterium]
MEVRLIDPGDEEGFAECGTVLEASDREMWPELHGYSAVDLRAFVRFEGKSRRWELLAATDSGGPVLGIALMEFPKLENPHATEIILAVHPSRRRRGVGTALVEKMVERAAADNRRTLNTIVDVPLGLAGRHASEPFALRLGFEQTLTGNKRLLRLPFDPDRRDELRAIVSNAPGAGEYRTLSFVAPWPDEFVDDHSTLLRVMSTDEPAGDGEREAEDWDAERLRENETLEADRGVTVHVAVAQHVPSGRLVAVTELGVAADAPDEAWQQITVVHPDHRGHRLGLAVKLANLDLLAEHAGDVRIVQTGNAAVNKPMIAVNEMMGFEVFSEGAFWQKHLAAPGS